MAGWMTEQLHAGETGSAMWANPDAMRATCRQWMSTAPGIAGSGGDASAWCNQMVAWMSQYGSQWGSWNDWMMHGPMMGASGSAACSVPNLSGTVVRVTLASMGGPMMGGSTMGGGTMRLFADQSTVPSGKVSFVAANPSAMTHELVVLPLGANQAVGERAIRGNGRVAETASLGEASNTCGAGAGEVIAAGSAGWVTLDLAPGRYELVCNLPGHYTAGMYTLLTVT